MKLVVEVDGGIHKLPEIAKRDAARDAWFASQGYAIITIPNTEALDADAVAARIRSAAPHP